MPKVLLILLAVGAMTPLPAAADAPARRVLVLPFDTKGIPRQAADKLAGLLDDAVAAHEGFAAIGGDERKSAVSASKPRCLEKDECRRELGRSLHAELVVSGSLVKHGSRYLLTLAVAQANGTAAPQETSEETRHLKSLPANVKTCVDRVFDSLPPPPPSPPAPKPETKPTQPPPPPAAKTEKHGPPQKRRSLALIAVTSGEGISEKTITTIEEVMLSALDGTGRFKVIGRSDINALMSLEARKQAMGCSEDTACMAQIAGALGVDLVATANLGKLGSTIVLSLKVIDVATASVAARAQQMVESDNALGEATTLLANQIVVAMWPEMKGQLPTEALHPSVRRSSRPLRLTGWAGIVVGVISAGIATGLAVSSAQLDSHIKSTKEPGAAAEGGINTANARQTAADSLFGVGGALGAAGLGLVLAF